ncbi:MAG TPA: TOBE domain-containing protein [Symbiobacteriaceae bacterium]
MVSVRPDSFDIDPRGPIAGVVRRVVYSGNIMEVLVECQEPAAGVPLMIHAHPSHPHEDVTEGQRVRFRPKPDFVSIIEDMSACSALAGHEGYRLPESIAG